MDWQKRRKGIDGTFHNGTDFESKVKSRISIDDDFPREAYQLLVKRRKEINLPLDSDEIKYYNIFIQVVLTGTENGQEEDYMSLDMVSEIASVDDKIEFDVLSHGVM